MSLSGSVVNSWTDTVSNVKMNRSGSPTVNATTGVNVDYSNFFQVSGVSAFKSYAALAFWENSGSRSQFPILCDSSNYSYHGGGVSNSGVIAAGYAHSYVKNSYIYDKLGYVGLGTTAPLSRWYNQWNVFIMTYSSNLPSFNRIGRDREYHEFNGKIKEIMFFTVDLYANTDLRNQVTTYLASRIPA
jgi:hypothetical protein